jgi:hypothetical protein
MVRRALVAAGVAGMVVAGVSVPAQAAPEAACWGQASALFAQMGAMGEHSAEQATPRLGLRNLARVLYAEGVIPGDSMANLGVFVVDALGLSIDACQG